MDNNNERIDNYIEKHTIIDGRDIVWTGRMNGSQPICDMEIGSDRYYINIRNYLWTMEKNKGDTLETSCKNPKCVDPAHIILITNWENVRKRLMENSKPSEKECRLWIASKVNGKYGQIVVNGKTMGAHRASWMAHNEGKQIPENMVIRHLCGNSLCINPDHLKPGTHRENMNDKLKHGTDSRGDKSSGSTISDEIRSQIKRSKRKRGEPEYETQKQRAAKFNVSVDMITSIDCGHTGGHIPDRDGNAESESDRIKRLDKRNERRKIAKERIFTTKDYEKAEKILDTKKIVNSNNCWEYTGCTIKCYGIIFFLGVQYRVHVLSCEIKEGRKRKSNEVTMHLCNNKICFNPDHLKFGSSSENARDARKNDHKGSKLTHDNVREIRKSSDTMKELAQKYNVSVSTIGDVIIGKTWNHIK